MACKSGRSEERENYLPAQNGFATLPVLSMVSQSCLNAARFITHLHTTPTISFFSRTSVQMPMPSSPGQMALSGERLSVAAHSPTEIAVTVSHESHWEHRSGGKKNQQNPFLTGLKFCSNGLRAFTRLCATVPSDGLTQKGKQGDEVSAGLASYPRS